MRLVLVRADITYIHGLFPLPSQVKCDRRFPCAR